MLISSMHDYDHDTKVITVSVCFGLFTVSVSEGSRGSIQAETPKTDVLLERRLSNVIGLQLPVEKPKTKRRPSVLTEEIPMF